MSIFQHAYHLRKDKTKYRGLFKNKAWAFLRALWVIFVRIANHLAKNGNKTLNTLLGVDSVLIIFLHYCEFVVRIQSNIRNIAMQKKSHFIPIVFQFLLWCG